MKLPHGARVSGDGVAPSRGRELKLLGFLHADLFSPSPLHGGVS